MSMKHTWIWLKLNSSEKNLHSTCCLFQIEGLPPVLSTFGSYCPLSPVSPTSYWGKKKVVLMNVKYICKLRQTCLAQCSMCSHKFIPLVTCIAVCGVWSTVPGATSDAPVLPQYDPHHVRAGARQRHVQHSRTPDCQHPHHQPHGGGTYEYSLHACINDTDHNNCGTEKPSQGQYYCATTRQKNLPKVSITVPPQDRKTFPSSVLLCHHKTEKPSQGQYYCATTRQKNLPKVSITVIPPNHHQPYSGGTHQYGLHSCFYDADHHNYGTEKPSSQGQSYFNPLSIICPSNIMPVLQFDFPVSVRSLLCMFFIVKVQIVLLETQVKLVPFPLHISMKSELILWKKDLHLLLAMNYSGVVFWLILSIHVFWHKKDPAS